MSDSATTNKNAARYQWLAAPVASPGSCGGCGKSANEKGFVTTGMDFEFYGTLIFCADCALDLGSSVGGLAPKDYAELMATNVKQSEEIVELLKRLSALGALKDAIQSYNDANNGSDGNHGGSVLQLVQPEEHASESDAAISEPDATVNDPEPTDIDATEPVSVEGTDDSTDAASIDTLLNDLGLD